MPTYLSNLDLTTEATPALRLQVQASCLYQWLTFINGFSIVEESSVGVWDSTEYSGSDGSINGVTPQQFYSVNDAFNAASVGKYIAILDSTNPSNSHIGRITAYVSATQVTLDSSAVLDISSPDVEFRVFDASGSPPLPSDYFVIGNPAPNVPWQARCTLGSSLSWDLGFIGGWNTATSSWDLPVSAPVLGDDDSSRLFCVADPLAGYFFVWTERTGGSASDRNAYWLGSISPFHSPEEPGIPSDNSYSAVLGTQGAAVPTNLSLDTSLFSSLSVGAALGPSLSVVPLYIAQKRFLSTGTAPMDSVNWATNPFSLEVDDYDAVVFHQGATSSFRGKIPGMRILNSGVPNRTSVSGNATYVLGNGIGSVWSGKVPQP